MPQYDGFSNVPQTAENLSKLLHVIDLICKKFEVKSKYRDAYYFEIASSTVFKKIETLGKKCINLANDCIRSHHFEEAAKLLWVICQDKCCFHTLLFKGMMIVLENLEFNDKDDAVLKMCSDIQDQAVINKLDVQLEYILYALRNDVPNIPESYEKLTSKRRCNKLKKIPVIEQALAAYRALLDYIVWHNSRQDAILSVHSDDIAVKAITNLKNVINQPGTWDVFILKLVEMLEYYEKYDEIEAVLKKYVKKNPEHVNAYVYLCVHLYKYNKDKNEVVQYAEKMSKLCPSDIRVLLLVHVWNEQGQYLKKRLKILFMYLDYPVNGKDLLGWKMLCSHLTTGFSSETKSTSTLVKSLWGLRRQAWNYMYFQLVSASAVHEANLELIACKVKVLIFLEPGHDYVKNAPRKISRYYKDGYELDNFTPVFKLEDHIDTR